MTEELKPCPAGHTTTYIVEDVQVGVNLTATAFYGECECGWRGPIRYQSRQGAAIAWNTRAESADQKPVAWVDVKDSLNGPYEFHGKEYLPKGPHELYTHPESAEVERLREENKRLRMLTDAARQIVNINENDYIDSFPMYEAIDNLANCLAQLPEES